MTNKLSDKFAVIRRAAGHALDRASSVTNHETDEDLRIYENLPMEAFDALVAKHGPDEVIKYIKAMEAKKMRR